MARCGELAISGRQLQAQADEARCGAQAQPAVVVVARRFGLLLLPLPDERLQPERELQPNLLFLVVLISVLLGAADWWRMALQLGLGLAHVGVGVGVGVGLDRGLRVPPDVGTVVGRAARGAVVTTPQHAPPGRRCGGGRYAETGGTRLRLFVRR